MKGKSNKKSDFIHDHGSLIFSILCMMVDLLMVIINIKMGNTEPYTKPFENEVYLDQIQ